MLEADFFFYGIFSLKFFFAPRAFACRWNVSLVIELGATVGIWSRCTFRIANFDELVIDVLVLYGSKD